MQILESKNLIVSNKKGTLPSVPFDSLKNKILKPKYDLSIVFVSPARAKQLNIDHRNKAYIPDTLAFPLNKDSGEIVICDSAIRSFCKKNGVDYLKHMTFILIHSMLHLKGYSHGGTMERKEKQLLKLFT